MLLGYWINVSRQNCIDLVWQSGFMHWQWKLIICFFTLLFSAGLGKKLHVLTVRPSTNLLIYPTETLNGLETNTEIDNTYKMSLELMSLLTRKKTALLHSTTIRSTSNIFLWNVCIKVYEKHLANMSMQLQFKTAATHN